MRRRHYLRADVAEIVIFCSYYLEKIGEEEYRSEEIAEQEKAQYFKGITITSDA